MNKFGTSIFLIAICLSIAHSMPYIEYDGHGLSDKPIIRVHPEMEHQAQRLLETGFASDNQIGYDIRQNLYDIDLDGLFRHIFALGFHYGLAKQEYQPPKNAHRLRKRQDEEAFGEEF